MWLGMSATIAKGLSLGVVVGLAAMLAACEPDSSDADDGEGGDGGSSGNGSGNGNGNGTTGSGFDTSGPSTGTSMECAKESIEAKLAPLTMYVTFDRSGSMQDNNKWSNATGALRTFVMDPSLAGSEMALRFFPENNCGENNGCNASTCAMPKVASAELTAESAPMDMQEQALINAINGTGPNGDHTPIYAALAGGVQWAIDYQTLNPHRKIVVLLVTDGRPNGCNENIGAIAGLAGNGFASGIVTYAVGLQGSAESDMNQIAQAGGSNQGYFIGNANAQQDLLAALKAIRGEQIACDLLIPTPTEGDFDSALVNVQFTPSTAMTKTIGNVANLAACGPTGGWYYDDPANPTRILLCPASCDEVQADEMGKLDILLGCATIPQ
jgi:hypothetical protein